MTPNDEAPAKSTGGHRVERRLARPGGLSYLHIPAIDLREAASFYEIVFGWIVQGHDSDRPSFDDGTGHVSGAWVSDQAISREPGLMPFIYVDDIHETVGLIAAHGGEIVQAPRPEGNLSIARFRDPAGNLFGVWHDDAD